MTTLVRLIEVAVALLASVYVIGNLAALCVRWRQSRRWLPVVAVLCVLSVADSYAAGRVFFDDSEAGNTNLWNQDGSHPRCTSVTTAADGLQGPYAGSRMIRCNADGVGGDYETLASPSFAAPNEVLYRYRVRVDSNHDDTFGSTHKLSRIFTFNGDTGAFVDTYSMVPGLGNHGMYNDMLVDGARGGGSLYWGDASGDATANPATWHTIEYYLNKTTGVGRVWHDDILVRDHTFGPIAGELGENGDFYITSNWEDSHDATNYVYFDNVEIFTNLGTGGTGALSDGTITQGAGGGQEATPGVLSVVAALFSPTVTATSSPSSTPSSVILFLEWVPLLCGLLWHVRAALLSTVLAMAGWAGTTVILAHEEVKQVAYQAIVASVNTVGTLLGKARH